jgi:SAM-dependent methyltransferase
MSSSSDALRNRAVWDRKSDEYQERNAAFIGRPEPRWGMWQLPESELGVLGEVAGKDVLELGCGAAHWSILLAQQGARMVGLDNSARQLEHAHELMVDAGVDFPLVHSGAEEVPLPDASFDVVFCDHGAMSFADPNQTVPEVASTDRELHVGRCQLEPSARTTHENAAQNLNCAAGRDASSDHGQLLRELLARTDDLQARPDHDFCSIHLNLSS